MLLQIVHHWPGFMACYAGHASRDCGIHAIRQSAEDTACRFIIVLPLPGAQHLLLMRYVVLEP